MPLRVSDEKEVHIPAITPHLGEVLHGANGGATENSVRGGGTHKGGA